MTFLHNFFFTFFLKRKIFKEKTISKKTKTQETFLKKIALCLRWALAQVGNGPPPRLLKAGSARTSRTHVAPGPSKGQGRAWRSARQPPKPCHQWQKRENWPRHSFDFLLLSSSDFAFHHVEAFARSHRNEIVALRLERSMPNCSYAWSSAHGTDDPNMVAYNSLAKTYMEVVAPNDNIHDTEAPWSEIVTWMDDILFDVMGCVDRASPLVRRERRQLRLLGDARSRPLLPFYGQHKWERLPVAQLLWSFSWSLFNL